MDSLIQTTRPLWSFFAAMGFAAILAIVGFALARTLPPPRLEDDGDREDRGPGSEP